MKKNIFPITSGFVLLGISTALGFLGKPTEMGLAITAGALGLAFSNIDKFKTFKGAGFSAEMRDQMIAESVVVQQTDDTVHLKALAFEINERRQQIMSSLLHTEYYSRSLGGIAKALGYPKDIVADELEWMREHDLASKRNHTVGYLWNLTETGMALLPIVIFGKN